jgi:hypothetical protein
MCFVSDGNKFLGWEGGLGRGASKAGGLEKVQEIVKGWTQGGK